ncbi:MAG: hypothetical protein NC918_08280 [Candidatus Omnitrophica bacterium]|nr:hypothetical protein [Candidatus Omnitrophota bacterium]
MNEEMEIKSGGVTAEEEQLKQELRELVEQGNNRVYTVLKHVSTSGMRRVISVLVAIEKGEIVCIDWYLGKLGLYKLSKEKEGVIIDGCGFDAGYDVVYSISYLLYGDGYKITHQWL